MSQITSIEPQKKKKDRFNIYLDNHFAFGISENVLVKNNLKVGQQLTSDQIEKIVKENELGKLVDRALRFLSYRPRSEKEVTAYLAKKIASSENIKYSEAKQSPLISQVIKKLTRYQYINDHEFAKWFLESRTKSQPKGLNLIKAELIKKGIGKNIIESVLSQSKDQLILATRALEKKSKRWQNLTELEFKKKVYSYLLSRGFDYETVKEVVANFLKKR